MRREERVLPTPPSAGPGDPVRTASLVDKWVEVEGTFGGSAAVEGRLTEDSATWYAVETAAGGTPALIEVLPLFFELRLNTANVTSGTPVARLVALDRRTA